MPTIVELSGSDSEEEFDSSFRKNFDKLLHKTMKANFHDFFGPINEKLDNIFASQAQAAPPPTEGYSDEEHHSSKSKKASKKRKHCQASGRTEFFWQDLADSLAHSTEPPTRPSRPEEEPTGKGTGRGVVVDYSSSEASDHSTPTDSDEDSRWDFTIRPKRPKGRGKQPYSHSGHSNGEESFLSPESLKHPRSSDWSPHPKVADYLILASVSLIQL